MVSHDRGEKFHAMKRMNVKNMTRASNPGACVTRYMTLRDERALLRTLISTRDNSQCAIIAHILQIAKQYTRSFEYVGISSARHRQTHTPSALGTDADVFDTAAVVTLALPRLSGHNNYYTIIITLA